MVWACPPRHRLGPHRGTGRRSGRGAGLHPAGLTASPPLSTHSSRNVGCRMAGYDCWSRADSPAAVTVGRESAAPTLSQCLRLLRLVTFCHVSPVLPYSTPANTGRTLSISRSPSALVAAGDEAAEHASCSERRHSFSSRRSVARLRYRRSSAWMFQEVPISNPAPRLSNIRMPAIHMPVIPIGGKSRRDSSVPRRRRRAANVAPAPCSVSRLAWSSPLPLGTDCCSQRIAVVTVADGGVTEQGFLLVANR